MLPASAVAIHDPSLEAAAENIRRWRRDPVAFVQEVFKVEEIEPDQRLFLEAFPTNRRLAVAASKGTGKTAELSWGAWNFLTTRLNPKVIVTSITWPNLRDNLWAEMGKWYARSPMLQRLFRFGIDRITNPADREWFASARSWSRSCDPDQQSLTLAGIHADNVLVICDEAGGYPDSVMAALEAVLSVGTDLKIAIGGNPTHLSGPLFRACHKERGMWHVTRINADPDSPTRSKRVRREWALAQIEKYGRDSAYVQVNVFGQFPRGATDALIPLSLFDDAFARWECPEKDLTLTRTPRTMGVDIARKGNDESVVAFREGDYLTRFVSWHGQKTTESTGKIAALAREFRPDKIYVDDTGVGGGVTDQLEDIEELRHKVVGVIVGEKARKEPEMHHNLRSEINLGMQERFRARLIAINPEIRDSTPLAIEGSTLKVKFTASGRRIIESKDEYIARTQNSPDHWDATALAYCDLGIPNSAVLDYYRMLHDERVREIEAEEKAEECQQQRRSGTSPAAPDPSAQAPTKGPSPRDFFPLPPDAFEET